MRLLAALTLSVVCFLGGFAAAPPDPPMPKSLPETGTYRYMTHQEGDFVYFVLPDAAPPDGIVTTWAIMAPVKPRPYGGGRMSYIALFVQFDCTGMRQRILGTVTYNDKDQVLPDKSYSQEWRDIAPKSNGVVLMRYLCEPDANGDQTLSGVGAFQADLKVRREADQP